MSSFRAYLRNNIRSAFVDRFTPAGGADAFVVGDLWFFDTGTNNVKLCGANPALIAGLAEAPSAQSYADDGKIDLRTLNSDDIVVMSSATDFADTMIGDSVDIVRSSAGIWRVVPGSTGNPRVVIRGGVPSGVSGGAPTQAQLDGSLYFVQFIAANLQFDAVAS